MERESEKNKVKSATHLTINTTLIFISFTIFTFIASVNSIILKDNFLLTIQLVLSIPFFMSSILSRAKLGILSNSKKVDEFGHLTFTIAYAFLINVVGILLVNLVSLQASLIFFGVNIALTLIYSVIMTIEEKKKLRERIMKDLFFILVIVIGGILPVLGVY